MTKYIVHYVPFLLFCWLIEQKGQKLPSRKCHPLSTIMYFYKWPLFSPSSHCSTFPIFHKDLPLGNNCLWPRTLWLIASPTQTEIKVLLFPSFQRSSCWFWPKVPTVMPCIVVSISSLLCTHWLFMHDAHKILKDLSLLMIDTEDKSTGMPGSAVALVTVSSGTWEAGALLCSQKLPWDSHDSVSDRDCTLLSLIQKFASLAFRRCCDSGLWIRIYHSDFCFCLQGRSQSQFNSLLAELL